MEEGEIARGDAEARSENKSESKIKMEPIVANMSQPGAVEIASFLAVLFFLTAGTNQVLRILDRVKDKPPASQVQKETLERFTTKDECAMRHGELIKRVGWLDDQRVQDAKDQAIARSRIYDEVKAIQASNSSDMSRVRVEMGEMERRLMAADETRTQHLHDRLNEILSEVGEIRGQISKQG